MFVQLDEQSRAGPAARGSSQGKELLAARGRAALALSKCTEALRTAPRHFTASPTAAPRAAGIKQTQPQTCSLTNVQILLC